MAFEETKMKDIIVLGIVIWLIWSFWPVILIIAFVIIVSKIFGIPGPFD
jgi:hypothetical protein